MSSFLSCFSPLLPSKGPTAESDCDDDKAEFGDKAGLVRPSGRSDSSVTSKVAKVDTTDRVAKLRDVMEKEGLGA